jgi:hypothetical protein
LTLLIYNKLHWLIVGSNEEQKEACKKVIELAEKRYPDSPTHIEALKKLYETTFTP